MNELILLYWDLGGMRFEFDEQTVNTFKSNPTRTYLLRRSTIGEGCMLEFVVCSSSTVVIRCDVAVAYFATDIVPH